MVVKLEDPKYTYVGNGIVTVSANVVIYTDSTSNTEILFERTISAKANMYNEDVDSNNVPMWLVIIRNSLLYQAQLIVDVYKTLSNKVTAAISSDSTSLNDILIEFVSDVESKITT